MAYTIIVTNDEITPEQLAALKAAFENRKIEPTQQKENQDVNPGPQLLTE